MTDENMEKSEAILAEMTEKLEKLNSMLQESESIKNRIEEEFNQAKAAKESLEQKNVESEELQKKINSNVELSLQSLNEINAYVPQAKTASDDIKGYAEKSQSESAKISEIARTADEKDGRVNEYEGQLKILKKSFEDFNAKLEKLLPAATGIGLAKSFNDRKSDLQNTIKIYFRIFLAVSVGFMALGIWALLSNIESFSAFAMFVLERTPIIVGLVLLEEFARRQFTASVKLEEDYAYKESISIAFYGFKKALAEIDILEKETLANTFSKTVIGTLGERPGRLVEMPDTASKNTADMLKALVESPKAAVPLPNLVASVRDNLKKSALTISVVIALSISVGCAIGYYFSSIKQGAPISATINLNQNEKSK